MAGGDLLITSHERGIASTQLVREIGVTQKAPWFMLHRLHHAARTRSINRPGGGNGQPVEVVPGSVRWRRLGCAAVAA